MCLEADLPEGVMGPHGLARHGMEDWKVVVLFFLGFAVACAAIVALSFRFAGRP